MKNKQQEKQKPAASEAKNQDKEQKFAPVSASGNMNGGAAPSNTGRGRRVRKWIGRIVVIGIVLMLLFRVSLVWVIPAVINRTAGQYGLTASVERVELSVLGTDAGLWHLKLSPAEGGDPLASIDYMRAKVATWALLTGNLHVRRLEAEGVELRVHRNTDGRLPLLDRVLASLPKSKEQQKQKQSALTLAPPLQVDAMRLTNLKIVFFDEFADPSIQSDVNLNLTLSDLDSPDRPTRFEMELRADPILDYLHIHGVARTSPEELTADLNVQMHGLHPRTIDGYLRLVGLKPIAKQINAGMSGKAHITIVNPQSIQTSPQPVTQPSSRPAAAPSTHLAQKQVAQNLPPAAAIRGIIELHDITLTADDEPAAVLDKLTLNISTLDGNLANCAVIDIQGVRAHASRAANGRFRIAGLEFNDHSDDQDAAAQVATSQPAIMQPLATSADASAVASTNQSATPPTTESIASSQPKDVLATTASASRGPAKTSSAFRWRLGELDLKQVILSFHDAYVTPAVDLSLQLDRLTLKDPSDQAFGLDTVVSIEGHGSLPGIAGAVEMKGEFRPFQMPLDLRSTVMVTKIQPSAIETYLKGLGLASQMRDGSLTLDVQADWQPLDDGGFGGNLSVRHLVLTDGEPLFQMDAFNVRELLIQPGLNEVSVKSVTLQGMQVKATREPSGNIHLFGFRTTRQVSIVGLAPDLKVEQASGEMHGETSFAVLADKQQDDDGTNGAKKYVATISLAVMDVLKTLPHVHVGHFSWKNIDVTLDDQMVRPATKTHVTDAGMMFDGFEFDPQAEALSGVPGKFHFWLSAPDVFGKVNIEGDLLAGGQGLSLKFGLNAESLQSKVLSPYLVPFGFEPLLTDGSLTLGGKIQAVRGQERWLIGATLDQLTLSDGQEILGSVAGIELVDFSLEQDTLGTRLLQVDQPHLQARRTSDGSLVVLGMKIHPGAELPEPIQDAISKLLQSFSRIQANIVKVNVAHASLDWRDAKVSPAASLRTIADMAATGIDLGHGNAAGTVDATIQVPGVVDRLNVKSQLTVKDNAPRVVVTVRGEGLKPEQVKAYLPAGISLPWKNGMFKADVEASLTSHQEGGHYVRLDLADLDLRDSGQDQPMLALKQATLDMPRFDPQNGLIQLAQLSATGLETYVHRAADGTLSAAGVTLVNMPEVQASTNHADATESATTQPAGQHSTQASTSPTTQPAKSAGSQEQVNPAAFAKAAAGSTATEQSAASSIKAQADAVQEIASILSKRRQTAPLIAVMKLEFQISRFTLTDDMRPKSLPLVIKNFKLVNDGSIEVLGPASKQTPPVKLKISLEPSPIAKEIKIDLIAKPFDDQAMMGMSMEITGINGQGLLDVLPELATTLKADDLKDGMFKTRFGVLAKLNRVRPWEIDFAKGGVFNMGLVDMELRQSPDGLLLGGVKRINVEGINVAPAWKSISIKNADVSQLAFNGWRDEAGLHMMGFTLPISSSDPGEVKPQTPDQPQVKEASENTNKAQSEPVKEAVSPGMLVELNRITISGLNGNFEDRTVKPVMVLPLTGLDVDARNISNSPQTQTQPLRFNMLVSSGKVKVPVREQGFSVTGVLGDTAKLITGRKTKTGRVKMVERDLFSQITASGRIRFNPKADGWVKFSVSSLDLWPLRGLATEAGVVLGSGVLDMNVDARFEGKGEIGTKSRVVLSDLSVSEPANGLISRYLALPAPLDAVIIAVRASDGSITLPVNLTLKERQVSKDQLIRQVLGAVGNVIVKAFAASPMKLANGVTSFVGVRSLLGSEAKTYEPVVIEYLPGETTPEPPFTQAIDKLMKIMASDAKLNVTLRSQISGSDVQIASVRANPTREECMQMIADLSQRVRELSYRRADVAGQARAQLASMATEQAEKTRAKLRLLDQQMVRTSEALDSAYDLLQPSSQWQSMRRTRNAAIAIGQARLEYIAMKIYESDIPNSIERVQVTPAQFNPIEADSQEATDEDSDQTTDDQSLKSETTSNKTAGDDAGDSEQSQASTEESQKQQGKTSDDAGEATQAAGQVVITLIPTR